MKYVYYPGCSAESTARDHHMSILEVARALDIDVEELKGWTCCGSTPAHHTDKLLSLSLPAANLLKAQESGLNMVVSCAACFNRMKVANHEIRTNPDVKKQIANTLGKEYGGDVEIRHFIEILLEDIGIQRLKDAFTHSINDLKVVSYYGCLLVRPHEITKFDDPENPTSMDRLVEAMGGEALDWPHKVECCGGGFALSRPDIVIELSDSILGMAEAAGAQCIAVACPMCQVNLDLRQKDINRKKNRNYNLPIVYITQLLGLCLGISQKRLGMKKCIVSPMPVIEMLSKAV
ncbi:MAG: CoB--CoM heterodisulfide reductase iron-sulfur subunit B family protein [Bacteroidales bacterium]|nr:MAG: CoB--CoM heterodisulfide reductase iron-sulfur subunit B family protein [Bacteroidales bacterium]